MNERLNNSSEQEPESRPSIYVASLADYVNGTLHGEWLDATQTPDELHEQVQRMLAQSPLAEQGEAVEEWAIHDYEGFGSLHIGEYDSFETVSAHAKGIQRHGLAYTAWYDWSGEADADKFQDEYLGEFDSVEAYAQQCGDDFGWEEILNEQIPASLRPYVSIDYEQLALDLTISGDIYAADNPAGRVWLFHP